ncbi:PIN domain-containing protein [Roseitalea porphyridii]|uniref:PIN domain-containing protein n=1 Tax=Roseitalea porphyridii TaxID=1852022 RepID=UPI003D187181
MRPTLDTNVLLRVALQDDVDQARAALETIMRADELFVPLPVLCEFVWVARSA